MKSVRRALSAPVLTGLVCLLTGSTIAAEPDEETRRHLVLFVTSGLSGHYAGDDGTIAGLVATLRLEADAARAAGHDVAILDAGRTLVPYAESRSDEGVTMVKVLNALPCDAFVPAPMDLTLELRRVADVARALEDCPSVRAFDSEHPHSQDFVPTARIELGGERPLRLEIRSAFDPVFFGDLTALGVDADRFPLEALAADLSADSVQILVAHSRGFGDTLVDRALTWKAVREPLGFDLVIDPDLGHDIDLERRIRDEGSEDGSVFLVGRSLDTATPWTYARIDMPLRWMDSRTDVGRWRPTDVELTVRIPDPDVALETTLATELEAAFGEFRRVWDEDLIAGAPTDREELIEFTLDALRERARAEIAIVNRGVLRPVAEPYWTPPLTRETVLRLLTLDQQLAVGELTGRQLRDLWTASHRRRKPSGEPTASALRFRGLSRSIESTGQVRFHVNGRPLRDTDPYRVVTNTFLTSGGDDYSILAGMDATRLEQDGEPMEARDDVVLPRLGTAIQPLWNPSDRPLWRLGIEKLSFDANSVSVSADPAYAEVADSRASGSDASQAKLALTLFADQDWPIARWENRLRVRYGVVETDVVGELADDLRLEVAWVFQRGPWERAEPYLAYLLDSELRRNRGEDGSRLPRQHEQSLALGLSWQAERWPRIRLGVTARQQDDVDRADRFGMTGETWYRKPVKGRRPGLEFDALAEYVEGDEAAIGRFDLDLRLVFKLPGGLELTPGLEYYVYDDSRLQGSAEYRSLTLGLRWAWLRKIQR
ncbi:MAG: 5'-nucleotidase C-terminal domain-containing protein [Thermoanaerobaculia bacterium]|nr:5'-nucleotidase C-terminal domain-containing protein [Thermoanaerobaculia bacterium]